MQAAGTLRGTRAISLLVLLVPLIGHAYSSPLQYLPSIPGYIPVYIRHGDEPLENINPELAEAFGETANSAKSLQLDNTLAHVSDRFKDNDIDALLAESSRKHVYPLRVRAAESRSFATVNDNRAGDKSPAKPKLLNIYELPDDNETRPRRRHRGKSRTRNQNRKAPAFKISPPSDAENERGLEKLAAAIETKPNELYVPNLQHSDSPSEVTRRSRRKHHRHNSVAPLKVQNPLDESSNLSEIPQLTDPSNGCNVTTSETGKRKSSIRRRPAMALPHANKASSIDLPVESRTNKDIISEAGRDEPPVKEQRPATILSNVDKISPINLLDRTNENDKKKDSAEPNDEIAME